MIDWLALWGVSTAFGLLFRPVLEKLAKGAVEDFARDVIGDALANVLRLDKNPVKRELTVATGRAIKEFLQLVQQELENSNLEEHEIVIFTKHLERLLHLKDTKLALGTPFRREIPSSNGTVFASAWCGLDPAPPKLPTTFDWNRVARLYAKRVRAIREASTELREILAAEDRAAIRDALEVTAGLQPGFDLGSYREAVRERYGRLKLESLDTDGYAYDDLTLWRMFVPQMARESLEFLPRLFELPKEHLRRLRERKLIGEDTDIDFLEERRRAFLEQAPRSVLDFVIDPTVPHLVVLGDPGSGKSSLLQYLLLRWVEEKNGAEQTTPLPLLLELREYARQRAEGRVRTFLDCLHNGTGLPYRLDQRELDARLRGGHAMLFLDGLDEVFDPALRAEVTGDIHRLSNEYPEARLIVTSRVVGYSFQPLRDAGFRHIVLQDLDDEQLTDFLSRWHSASYADPVERERRRASLASAIADSQAIRELAGNPLLLTMMAILNRHQDLPRSRADLYEQCSRLLLQQWKADRALRDILERSLHSSDPRLAGITLDLKDKQALLRLVAREMQTAPGGLAGNVIAGDQLEEVLWASLRDQLPVGPIRAAASALIQQFRERNFILCFLGGDSYAFVHRTFLEFFCAWDFVWRFEKERASSINELKSIFGQHYSEEAWREILTLIAGMLSPRFVAEIVEFLLERPDPKRTYQHVFVAGRCIGEVRNRVELGGDLEANVRQLLEGLVGLKKCAGWAEEQEASNIRRQAVSLVAAIWRDRDWLQRVAKNGKTPDVRLVALEALSRGWKDAENFALIKNLAISDWNKDVRRIAIEALGRSWKDEVSMPELLLARIRDDENPEVRQAAVKALLQCDKQYAKHLALLIDWAKGHEDWAVRRASINELSSRRKGDLDILRFLCGCASSDPQWILRKVAVEALARGWKDQPVVYETLRKCAISDEEWSVRVAAVQLLARERKEWVFELLVDRATKDSSAVIRAISLEALARSWKDNLTVQNIFAALAKPRTAPNPYEAQTGQGTKAQ